MNTAPCNCHTQTAKPSVNERPRYYARQLVTPDDLTLEQDYFRARLRRHNRYLHGWGVVCGAEVVESTKPWKVIVKTGYVLGPYGDEIFIETDQCIDVRKRCVTPDTPDDEECLEAYPAPAQDDTDDQWLAIRYVEKKTRLVKVPLGGCGCEDSSCEPTRFQDYYQICVIDHCPESHQNPPGPPRIGGGDDKPAAPACPECPDEPWVVLSAFTVDEEGAVTLSQCDCRRQVLGFGDFWWSCSVPEPELQPEGPADTPTEQPTSGTAISLKADTANATSAPATPAPATPAPATPPVESTGSTVAGASGATKKAASKVRVVKKEKSETPAAPNT
ncbi:MAG: hypothetical protein V7638_4828 [Acidobacteriota bacterium]|jgi:hypothetical protein